VQRGRRESPSTLRTLRAPSAELASAKPPRALALFREQAVAAHLATLRDSEVLRVAPPWVRGLVGFASLLTAVLLAAAFVVEVDQTARGRGVLRVAGGMQTVASQAAGTVLEIGARSGDVVRAGDLLVRVDSTATKTALLEAERHIERADEDVTTFIARRDKEQTARRALLGQRASLLRKRVQSQNVSASKLEEHLGSFDRLVAEGLAPAMDRAGHEREIASARRTSLQLEEEIATTNLQAVNTEAELAAELDRRKAEARRARDRRDALAFQLAQTEVRAPRAGRLEAMVAKAGEVVTVGGAIARLVPEGGARQVVVFLPEADRAFLREASDVRIELDQLPSGEFGALRAVVKRIATDLASPADVTDALGDARLEGPAYRVELELASDGAAAQLEPFLRPGSQVTARFVLRKRRLASLLFSPLKKWLDR
jgi:multidrug resistance efflux pump